MSNQFLKLRRSAVPGRVPSTSSIDFGEIALNTYDGLAFIKKSGSLGEEVITLGSREGAFTGSFSGSFVGNGGGLFNISASSIVGLNLSQIATGSVSASVNIGSAAFNVVSGSSNLFYISSSGNVGIGTITPTARLQVSGSTIFGNNVNSNHEFTGSMSISGSLTLDGDSTIQGNQINEGTYWRTISGSNFPSLPWRGIAYGNGLFVAIAQRSAAPVSITGSIATSPDGVNWTFRTLPSLTSLINITYQNGIFVAIGHLNQRAFYSYDGINWFNGVGFGGQGYGITYGKDKFVASKIDNPNNRISVSYDGINWQNVVTPSTMDLAFVSVTYANDRYVAVAESTVSGSIAISYDGINWNNVTRPLAGTVTTYSITYGKGLFVVACNQGKILTSPDGINWTARDTPLTGLLFKCIFAGGIFIAAGTFSTTQNRFIYSFDGITWKEANTPALNNWSGFAYGNGLLLSVTYNGTDSNALIVSSGVMNSFITQNDNIIHGRQTFTDNAILSGSNIFGNRLSNTHQFTGSVSITGSLSVNGGSVPLGSGATGQVAYWNGMSSQTGSNNLFWDGANNRLGIGTNTPTQALQVIGTMKATLVETPLVFSVGSDQLAFGTQGGTPAIVINPSTRNVVIQNGGIFGDSGERLQVSGSSRFVGNMAITGSGNTSGTNGLIVQNSSAVSTFIVRNDGRVSNGDNTFYVDPYVVGGTTMVVSNNGHNFAVGISAQSMTAIRGTPANATIGPSSTLACGVHARQFQTTTTNPTVGLIAEGAIIGEKGVGVFNQYNTSSILQVDSTTKGFLAPRMTAAQRTAIGTPARGLLVYDIDSATEGLWYYNSGSNPGWQEVLTNSGSQTISGSITANDITVTGTLTAQTIVTQTITSSIVYSSGSNIFGNSLSNTQQFTGSVSITGSLSVNGGSVPLGSGETGQVAYWNGTSSQTGSNNLFWDNANARLGIGTNTPASSLDIITSNPTNATFISDSSFITNLILQKNLTPGGNDGFALSFRRSDGTIASPSNVQINRGLGYINYTGYHTGAYRLAGGIRTAVDGSTSSTSMPMRFEFLTSNDGSVTPTIKMMLKNNGNLILENGGIFGDSGERLQVSGSSKFAGNMVITGSGVTSATNALTILNNVNNNLFTARNDGAFIFGGAQVGLYPSADKGISVNTGAGGLFLGYYSGGDLGYVDVPSVTIGRPNNRLLNATSATQIMVSVVGNYSPTSGTGLFRAFEIIPTINQTGGANGVTRGLIISPTLTAAADFRAIEWSNNASTSPSASWGLYGSGTAPNFLSGSLLIGSASNSGEKLQVDGTMKVTGDLNARARLHVESGIWFNYGGGAFNRKVMSNDNSKVTFRLPTDASSYDFLSWSTNTSLVTIGDFATKLNVIGNAYVSGTLDILDAEINYQRNNNVTTGSARLIASIPTASLNAAFFDYVIISGSNARAGVVTSVWASSSVEWNETYTNDIGSTSDVSLYSAITGSSIGLFATSSINNIWTIKSLIRTI